MAELEPITFISYSREDSEFALRLAQDLKAAGARVWLDQLDIAAGLNWDSAVEEALVESPRMLLILTPASAKSGNVRNEIHFAQNYGKTIIPVLHKNCIAPLALQRIQHVDFTGDYQRALGILINQLKTPPPKIAPNIRAEAAVAVTEVHANPAPPDPASLPLAVGQREPPGAQPALRPQPVPAAPQNAYPLPQPIIYAVPQSSASSPMPDRLSDGTGVHVNPKSIIGVVLVVLVLVVVGYYINNQPKPPANSPAAGTPASQPPPSNSPPPPGNGNGGGSGDAAIVNQQTFDAQWQSKNGMLMLTTAKWSNNSATNLASAVVQCEQEDTSGTDLSEYRVTLNGPTPANTWSSYSNISIGAVANNMSKVNCTIVHVKAQ